MGNVTSLTNGAGGVQVRYDCGAMSSAQRWRLNDGALRARIKEGDTFTYIGQDPRRKIADRVRFDLTRSELFATSGTRYPL